MTKIFQWHYANDKYMRNTANLARVAMVNSTQSGIFTAGGTAFTAGDGVRAAQRVTDFVRTAITRRWWKRAFPFEMADDRLMEPAAYRPLSRAGAARYRGACPTSSASRSAIS